MINLHVIQAEYGDCFVLESKFGKESFNAMIDGGPYQTFEKHIKPALLKLPLSGKLDLIVLSHIDNDHIIGLLDLLEQIKTEREKHQKELIKIRKLWHNSFNDIFQLKVASKTLFNHVFISDILKTNGQMKKKKNIVTSLIMKGFQQGTDLTQLAKSLNIKINPGFKKLIFVNETAVPIRLKNITFRILGPTKKNLDKLKDEWKDWLTKKKPVIESEIGLLQILDKSVPNLASIAFLVEIKSRKILFTGDGVGEDILRILSQNRMLDNNGKLYVDILKVPHHGSDRNASLKFFNTVYADYYIISANGRDDNPSLDTLKWIIQGESKYKKPRKIVFTNMTPNIKKVLRKYDKKRFNYECIFLDKKDNYLTINLR